MTTTIEIFERALAEDRCGLNDARWARRANTAVAPELRVVVLHALLALLATHRGSFSGQRGARLKRVKDRHAERKVLNELVDVLAEWPMAPFGSHGPSVIGTLTWMLASNATPGSNP